ncbi:MAG: hypothetical protein KJO50_05540 [Bacteroidia bacterium]|nr:hypothetical protein [Bacteroidia bacterium]MBT8229703.1 hypothetical protein [Bacteroidia bacterium]
MHSCIIAFFFLGSCSSTEEPVEIVGDWQVEWWEQAGCLDSISNFQRDLSMDGCFELDSLTTACVDYVVSFESNNTYRYDRATTIAGNTTTESETGQYELISNNRLSLCTPECDTLTYVRVGNALELIVPNDTLSGCGLYLRTTLK